MMVAIAVEELSKVDASAAILVDVQNTLVEYPLRTYATDAQKETYLGKLTAGTVGSYALSEAGSGSDAFALATRAQKDGDDWVLNGRKLWITNGAEAGIYIVFANANPDAGYKGITAFIVERDFPGFAVGKKEDKLGIRASSRRSNSSSTTAECRRGTSSVPWDRATRSRSIRSTRDESESGRR